MALKIKIQQTGYNLQRMKEKILMKQSMNSQGINSGIYCHTILGFVFDQKFPQNTSKLSKPI